jgi:hypothetical protein
LDKARKSSSGDLAPTDYWPLLKIQDKRDRIVPFALNAVQRHLRDHLTGRDLILKSRQQGASTYIQARQFVSAVTKRTRCATLAHDDDSTQMLRRMATRFWDNLPDDKRPQRGLDNATTTSYPATGSEVFIGTAGSRSKGRGGTYRDVHGSEVAFWVDAVSIMAGLMQGVAEGGSVVLESTPNGAQGWFYERCMEALDGNSDWTLHFYPWWWDAGYALPLEAGEPLVYDDDEARLVKEHGLTPEQIAWRRKKKRELGRLFLQEYPEDPRTCFLTSGDGYFADIADIDRVFSADIAATPQAGHRYVAALDFGQMQDYFALSIIDATTLQEVDLYRVNQKPWADMRGEARMRCQKWGVQVLYPERNSMGSTNIEELHKEFKQHGLKTAIQPFDMTPESKPSIVTGFHWALDEGGLKLLPDPVGRQEINTFKAKQTPSGHWTYEGKPHDDTVVARMICWHGIANGTVTLGRSTSRWA